MKIGNPDSSDGGEGDGVTGTLARVTRTPVRQSSSGVGPVRFGIGTNNHSRTVVISIIEKTLINLSVLSKVEVGEKLGWTSNGHFVIQSPSYWTIAYRLLNRMDRWTTLQKIQDVINTAESMCAVSDGQRISTSLKKSIHGIRNIQTTYEDDVLMFSSLNVLLDRLADRFGLTDSDLL